MNCLLFNFFALLRNRSIAVASGLLIFVATSVGPPASAQDQMMRRDSGSRGGDRGMDHGGGHGAALRGIGTGLAIGIGTGIIIDQLNKRSNATENNKAAKKTTKKEKKVAKKPLPKEPEKPQNGETPETPPVNQVDTPPVKIPGGNPVPPVAGPGPPPPTTDKPPEKTDKPPSDEPPVTADGPPVTTDGPPVASPPGGVEPPPPGGGVPPTQSTSTTPDQPTNPGTTPQDGNTPTDIVAMYNKPRRYFTTSKQCPQRGMGCTALIIDFLENAHEWFKPGAKSVSDFLKKNIACDPAYVAPLFKAIPEPYRVRVFNQVPIKDNVEETIPYENEVKEVKEYNKEQYKTITDAIDRHHEEIKRGKELVIEMLVGHGSKLKPCGVVGGSEGRSISRAEFHAGNYEAIYDKGHHHACGWFVADFSCYSGLTPEVVDELNNRGKLPVEEKPANLSTSTINDPEHGRPTETQVAACKVKPGDNCPTHAAYDYDLAIGVAPANFVGCGLLTPSHKDMLIAAFSPPPRGPRSEVDEDYFPLPPPPPPGVPEQIRVEELNFDSLLGFRSHYSDQGYTHCDPISRKGIWLGAAPVNANCETGKCR